MLLTRFNVRRSQEADARAISDSWLAMRMTLFREITVPSVARQSRLPDLWLVFFDKETPLGIQDEFGAIARECPILRAQYCTTLSPNRCAEIVQDFVPKDTEWLITTRLDNDDAIHRRFVEVIGANVQVGVREFINPTRGLIIAGRKAFRKRDYSSPFISLSEPARSCRTVWLDEHQRLSKHGHIRQVSLEDAWIQVVHGGNIANRVRGTRVRVGSLSKEDLPPLLASALSEPTHGEFVFDNTIGLVQRYTGSCVRRVKREWKEMLVR